MVIEVRPCLASAIHWRSPASIHRDQPWGRTLASSVIGIAAGAVQGYFGGTVDLVFQRLIEIWSGMPRLYLLIILAAIVEPNFWWLLGLLLLFEWMALVGVVRAEFLRARNFDYVRAPAPSASGTA